MMNWRDRERRRVSFCTVFLSAFEAFATFVAFATIETIANFLMSSQLRTLFIVLVVTLLGAAGYLGYSWHQQKQRAANAPPEPKGWEAHPAANPDGTDTLTNEVHKFSASAPMGWKAVVLNSTTGSIAKDGFAACKITTTVGDNIYDASAAGYVDKLNPYGKKDLSIKYQFAEEISLDNGAWPAAKLTVFTVTEGKKVEVHIPRGKLDIISNMVIEGALNEANNLVAHPRLDECEKAFNDYLATIHLTS